jgi:hypothetical protein
VAFTGDHLFGNPADPRQTGHEAVVAHNSAILEEGYLYAADYLHRLQPDLIVGGHSFVMDRPAKLIDRFRRWAYQMRDAFRVLSPDLDYRYCFDPFWVRVEPYRVTIPAGLSAEVQVQVRNFRQRTQNHRIEIHTPPGLAAEPAILDKELAGETSQAFPVRLRTGTDTPVGVHTVALDVNLDGQRLGEWFDCIVKVEQKDNPDRR